MVSVSIHILKLLQIVLLSGIKFMFAPLLSMGYGYNFLQTVLFTTIGGIAGLFFFYYLSKWLINQYYLYCPIIKIYLAKILKIKFKEESSCKYPNRKKFTRRNKVIISIRKKWGFIGVILFTPVLLSIPLGAFLAQKYYAKRNGTLFYLSGSIVFWSLFISALVFLV